MTNEIIEQIRNSFDICEIIGETVTLKKVSRGYVGICPFHDEKTGSFHVYKDTQSFYCFGCHKAGDVFTFVMEAENLTFPEVVKNLAERAGIKIPENDTKSKNLYDILSMSEEFYSQNLKKNPVAVSYLKKRELDENDITNFSLGYAPNSWNLLSKTLLKNGISENDILKIGMAVTGKNGIYDVFRGRIMFPIKNLAGKVIAFGGRLIDGDGAKYINSSENEIFVKSKNLYLLSDAKKSIREKRRAILVEGYMDAIRLHKNGFTEAVASLGTSLTVEQAKLIKRFTDRVYICYDNDKAGQNASIRGMYILAENGLDVYVVNLPESKDPDEYLIKNPPEKFEYALRNAKALILHHLEISIQGLKDLSTRKATLEGLFKNFSNLRVDEVLQYKTQISEITAIPPSKIEEYFCSNVKELPEEPEKLECQRGAEHPYEAALCSLLFHNSELTLKITPQNVLKIFRNPTAREVAMSILTESKENILMLWNSMGEIEKFALLERGNEFASRIDGENAIEKWNFIFQDIRQRIIKKRIKNLTAKLKKSLATPEDMRELQKLKEELKNA